MSTRTNIVQIGNSQGVRIPKPLLEQSGLGGDVELEVRRGEIRIRKAKRLRQGWDDAFQNMAERGDDALLDEEASQPTEWDKTEWTWPARKSLRRASGDARPDARKRDPQDAPLPGDFAG
jgi:antitoxin MazE